MDTPDFYMPGDEPLRTREPSERSGFVLSDHPGPVKGVLEYSVFRKGVLIEHVREQNLIVAGYSQVAASLIGGVFTNNNVTQIGFGTSGTAPVSGNSSLTSPFMKALDSVTFPSTGVVSFNFSLGPTQDNGALIFEFGLFTAASVLVARRVRSAALAKDADIALTGAWQLSF